MYSVENIQNNVQKHAPGWEKVPLQKIKVEKMTGITNLTFKIEDEEAELSPLIYRQFGES